MARGRHSSLSITLTAEEQQELEHLVRSSTPPAGLVRRAHIILLVAKRMPLSQVARTVGIRRGSVYKWTSRFLKHRLDGLADEPGRGRKPVFSP
jgi:transposase